MKGMTKDILESPKYIVSKTPVWSEEFKSGTVPDIRVWSYDLGDGGWGNDELETYTHVAANIRVADGNLIITALNEGDRFTSARIKTEDKFAFRYGTLEARIQVPDLGNGLWPALWALGHDFSSIGWPACSEIIVMEMGVEGAIEEERANRRITSAAHWEEKGAHQTYGANLDHPSDVNGSFHVYRMEWTPTAITTYVDDVQIWAMNISDIPALHEPHFLLLNMAVGGKHTGVCDVAGITAPLPAEYRVDYIRLFDNGFTALYGSSVDHLTMAD
ncbi:glycoside hydrolase family 16 protein [Pontiellaceae bacterium B1224]|nr:glycoside hydrolase family 16 protein [Pontiellaceae bacterium B1224]